MPIHRFVNAKIEKKNLNEEKFNELISVLKDADVLNWNYHYNNPHVFDGGNWYFVLTFNDGSKFGSFGYAEYPEKYTDVRNAIEEYIVVSSNSKDAYQEDMTGWINSQ